MDRLLRKYGGYVIDFIFGVGSIIAVVDFFVNDANHTAAFGIIALYSFGVIFRVRYVQKMYDKNLEQVIKAQEDSVRNIVQNYEHQIQELRNPKTPGT
jgi:hypothetical protein